MLSVDEVKNVSFGKASFGGYKAKEVDEFLEDVQTSYEEMMRKNRNLVLTVQKLENEIKKFHDEEASIKRVLVNLKSLTEKSVSDAKNKAKEVISIASETSEKMIDKAKREVKAENEILENLKKESCRLKKDLEDICKKHIEIIKGIPDAGGFEEDEFFNIAAGKSEISSDFMNKFKISSGMK